MKARKIITALAVAAVVIMAGIQFIRPQIPQPPVTGDIDAPANVKAILVRACYDCHSNQTNLQWFDKINPVYWRVAGHVKDGRAGLNFSEWDKLAPGARKGKLWESLNQVLAGAMPLKDYAFVHGDARLSKNDVAVLKNYVAGLTTAPAPDTATTATATTLKGPENSKLPVTLNGIAYIPDYKKWQPVSATQRTDNGTMRVILGNDAAVKAIQNNQVNPWPDGAILAKVAWQLVQDKQGNIHTGDFVQIEYMIKDHDKYASTAGWGFARFKTPQMKPYGETVMFTQECVNCHRPVADRDFVFTAPFKH